MTTDVSEQSSSSSPAQAVKQEGNDLFKAGDFAGALEKYTKALSIVDSPERAVLLNNRAAANLKLHRYEETLKDTSEDPKNSAVQQCLRRLSQAIEKIASICFLKMIENASTTNRVTQMIGVIENNSSSLELKNQAANNLVVISREKAGAEAVINANGIVKCLSAVRSLKNAEFTLSCIRIFSELSKKKLDWALRVLTEFGLPAMIDQFVSKDEQHITAVQYLFQTIINALSGMDSKESKKPDEQMMKDNEAHIDAIMLALVKSSSSRVMTAQGRDAILELITKNADYECLNWGMKLVDSDGLRELLEVASELEDIKYESSMDISPNTRPNCSVAFERIYFCMDYDKAKEKYREKVMDYVNSKLGDAEIESKVRVTATITTLLLGPLDVGNNCLASPGVVEMMLAMAGSEEELQQRVAAEAIIAAASKKDKCTSIISTGLGILKKLYKSENDNIKVRALVGLCKLGSFGGTDSSLRPFSDGTTLKLVGTCRNFLINPKKDKDLRKWAAEGLAYLTLDAEVKEDLISDKASIHALIDLAKTEQKSVLYGVLTTLVNLTNSYEKQEIIPELKELAKFAKQHVPEEHVYDSKEYVDKRTKILAESGVTVALVALSSTESKNSREMIARRISRSFTRLLNTAATSSCEDGLTSHRQFSPASEITRIVLREIEEITPALPSNGHVDSQVPQVCLVQSIVREDLSNLGFDVCAVAQSRSFGFRSRLPPRPKSPPQERSFPRSHNPAEWRTADDRPICFNCRGIAHVARYCRNHWSSSPTQYNTARRADSYRLFQPPAPIPDSYRRLPPFDAPNTQHSPSPSP
ncbi:hypothetical protein HPB51_006931 [Rhipicephalus microplus]|uniref:UNC-45/Cro1/She4 central domain-containing protein n=1 Tax=Rhipicephalus microplus TaxID=6941 RepID=A0A9J6DT43_RHIMP|nr:hypothetical protein HPB51_006931 [Rhipicephalus microplus]